MDISSHMIQGPSPKISCVEMHTTGEPVRLIYAGFPETHGTLLEQRAEASAKYDDVRQRLMLEPRGHGDMYGAILRQDTELVAAGQAHIGVLFCHNGGFSTMCGHATIALGRFLVDTADVVAFPNRQQLVFDAESRTVTVRLHAPCGLVEVTVPALEDGRKADATRPVSFRSVPSYATALDLKVPIPASHRWPELSHGKSVVVDICYGGTFYALVKASQLGFPAGLAVDKRRIDIDAISSASALLKDVINTTPELLTSCRHREAGLSFLYSIMVVDDAVGVKAPGVKGAETGLCFFGDHHQVDRSPTGSAVSARMAVAYAKRVLKVGDAWTYHSLVSNAFGGEGGFVGKIEEVVNYEGNEAVVVRTEGRGCYTGTSTFIFEEEDRVGRSGFNFDQLLKGVWK